MTEEVVFKSREEIIKDHPLIDFCKARGIEFITRKTGGESYAKCPLHEDNSPSFRVNEEKKTWFCDPCGIGGSVVDLIMQLDNLSTKEALEKLSGQSAPLRVRRPVTFSTNGTAAVPKIAATYDYTDAEGRLLYQVVRYEPKDFRQRKPLKEGGWSWKLEGVTRVLYNLPRIATADFIWVVEGEKDADLLTSYKQVATTNAGGAKKWESQYNEQLRDKEVLICGDNDEPGQQHVQNVAEELQGHARAIRIVKVPQGYKDVSEFAASFERPSDGISALLEIADKAEVTYRGKSIPVLTMGDMENRYRDYSLRSDAISLNLGNWLPTLSYAIRPLVPGEMACIVADTGVGKTMLLQNIAINSHLPTLLFEIELPDTLTFERFAGMTNKLSGRAVYETYRERKTLGLDKLSHIGVCVESRLTPPDLERIIEGAGIKTGRRPVVVMVDYVQLIRGAGKSRYENMSLVAEELKVIAKTTGVILLIASQRGRKDEGEVGLHDAKDSGSIENSCGLVMGAWRDEEDANRMYLKVLKNTKGQAGRIIPCRILDSLVIHEEAKQN